MRHLLVNILSVIVFASLLLNFDLVSSKIKGLVQFAPHAGDLSPEEPLLRSDSMLRSGKCRSLKDMKRCRLKRDKVVHARL